MIVLKFKIQNEINILKYQQEFNSCVRYCYNRFHDGLDLKDAAKLIKNNNFFRYELDSWFNQSAIFKAKWLFDKNPKEKIIFGGKFNFKNRSKKKISNDEWKNLRLLPLLSRGETRVNGNRKFELDISNNQIIFKPTRRERITIQLPKIRKQLKQTLTKLEEFSKQKKISFGIELTNDFIYIQYDENIFRDVEYKGIENRIFAIDMNPNYTGWSIIDVQDRDHLKVIQKGIIDISKLAKKLKVKSSDSKQIKQNNKRDFEVLEISKFLVEKAKHFRCSKFGLEDLNIQSKDQKKGKNFNRLVNNCWNRNKMFNNIKKRCNLANIEFVGILPYYSSVVGNLVYGEKYPDQIASSIEIGRRAANKYGKDWFYPNLINKENLTNRWKEALDWSYLEWKELFFILKTSKINYRSSLKTFDFKVLRLNNTKSKIDLYSFG